MSIIIKNIEYKMIEKLGEGAYGKVIKVKNESNNKFYAVKEIFIKNKLKDEIEIIQNEANILSKFNSKNIVKYYDSYKDKDKFYILMEYCTGKNLRDFISENKALIEENILYNIIKQICIGLKEIHQKKIIYRDLKPENICMNENMEIKIGDFGISKIFNSNKEYTLTQEKKGTVYYMAPEIVVDGLYNEKSDMYSLGCIIYELLNLRIYYIDNFVNEIKTIDSKKYNYKWEEIINSLLQIDYNKRMDINNMLNILINEMNINELNNKIENIRIENKNKNNQYNYKNKILGEIYINKTNINKDILIINSFEKLKREYKFKDEKDDYKYENEKEIKENIELRINGKIIEFTYYYKFKKEGKYIIEYSFKINLTKTNHIFFNCDSLTYLDLSNFNPRDIANMNRMFYGCNSLININLSNFNTKRVL